MDDATDSLDDALERVARWTHEGTARSIALCANAADVLPELVARGVTPDVLTDQTSAHDPLNGYVPNGLSLTEADTLRESDPAPTRRSPCKPSHATYGRCWRSRGAGR